MPQTRFVLRKALELGLKPDRRRQQDRPPQRAPRLRCVDEVLDLFLDLDAERRPVRMRPSSMRSARDGVFRSRLARRRPGRLHAPARSTIIDYVPEPDAVTGAPASAMLVSNIEWDDYRRPHRRRPHPRWRPPRGPGRIRFDREGVPTNQRVLQVHGFQGLGRMSSTKRMPATSSPSPVLATSTSAKPSPRSKAPSRCRPPPSNSRPSR
ncbi:MAG: hypothetical protein U5Q44_15025 [Dehalococcoidia bacterium]|nr:hypothetical protein [Dehalococcoidia bacterium]